MTTSQIMTMNEATLRARVREENGPASISPIWFLLVFAFIFTIMLSLAPHVPEFVQFAKELVR